MTDVSYEAVSDKTLLQGQTLFLTLRANRTLPQRLRAKFVAENQSAFTDVEVMQSSRDPSQLCVLLTPMRGQLQFVDEMDATYGQYAVDHHQLVRSADSTPPASGDVPAGTTTGGSAKDGADIRRIVTLERAATDPVAGQRLWKTIRDSSDALAFPKYIRFVDRAFSSSPVGDKDHSPTAAIKAELDRPLLFRVDAYERLRVATDVFVTLFSGVRQTRAGTTMSVNPELEPYLTEDDTLPYLQIIYDRLGTKAPSLKTPFDFSSKVTEASDLLERKAQLPCLLELIWSYWHEEGMLAQTMAAISRRFQNRRVPGDHDPLARLDIDPLRSINHLLWNHVQGEGDRLSVLRRAHEYEAEYGFPLHGKAVAALRASDRRSKFIEAFHNLLHRCVQFYRVDDDTTHVADGFAVLNAIKETHYVLSQGASNQFGDLPATARKEMLVDMYLLARPEMREFLGGRTMVAYPELWMDRVDNVKSLMRWTPTSVIHFHDLAVFGEQLLVSIRWDNWSVQSDPDYGKQWAREWRPEVQGYIHALRAATGVDLAAEITSGRDESERYLPPSVHLRRRLAERSDAP